MTRGPCGYGRYDDDPEHVGCPRAASDMTPCIARDGRTALADDLSCVGCHHGPTELLAELDRSAGGVTIVPRSPGTSTTTHVYFRADALAQRVRQLTNPTTERNP